MKAFERLVARLDAPVYIVTVAGDPPAGCLIGFATQTSVTPARFLACISRKNHTFDVVRSAETVVVHFLGSENKPLAELFGGETGDEVDKFELCSWTPGPGGAPVLDDCPGWFAGRVLERHDVGDHIGLLLEPFDGEDRGRDPDLSFQDVKEIDPGHPV
jgi:flavin reductase (DIM6/NTAB) family NADH-FMN oxidoreductase RutF